MMGPDGEPAGIRAIHLLPLGRFPAERIDALLAGLSRRVTLPCHGDPPVDWPIPRLAGREDQVDADGLLSRLEAETPAGSILRVGVTLHDLAIPIFTFVFGRARHLGRAALVSLARLDPEFYGLPPDPGLGNRRGVLECLHELGHLAGLRHCTGPRCLMRFAASLEAVDARGDSFCPGCASNLPAGLRTGSSSPE